MKDPVITLTLTQLSLAFIPVAIAVSIMVKWSMSLGNSLYALGRMLVQLMLVGYVLAIVFGARNSWVIGLTLALMLVASAWIALRTIPEHRWQLFGAAVAGISVGGGFTLAVVTQLVLQLEPWYMPRYIIPLAGMVFANAMTAVSLAGERLYAELKHGDSWAQARQTAFHAAMIPVVNSLFAVGLVSLPGMMTGQILSGVSPLVAARYQIMVMCMIFAAAAISTAVFLTLIRQKLDVAKDG